MNRRSPSLWIIVLVASLLSGTFAAAGHARRTAPSLNPGQAHKTDAKTPSRTPLNEYQSARLEAFFSGTAQLSDDSLSVIVLLVDFPDRAFERDSTFVANELKHLGDYYRGASRGHMELDVTFDDSVYTMSRNMTYYGNDSDEDSRVVELVQEAIAAVDDTVDFSLYEHVFIIHAGPGQETDINGDSRGQIQSSFYDRGDIDSTFPDSSVAGLATNDMLGGQPFFVDNFSIVPVDASQDDEFLGQLGIWAFTVGNRIGLLPLFDSEPGIPDSFGVGEFCVMAYGLFVVDGFIPSFPCAFNRMIAGWIDPVVVQPEATSRSFRLTDVNTGADTDTTCLRIPITEDEYYLVVNRVHDSNFDSLFTFNDTNDNLIPDNNESLDGAEFDFFLTDRSNPSIRVPDPRFPENGLLKRHTGSGVYVWHVDENVIRENLSRGYLVNDFAPRKGVDLEEADGVQDLDHPRDNIYGFGGHFDSYRSGDGNANAITPTSKPSTTANSGVRTGIYIENISVPGPTMTLSVRRGASYDDHRVRWSARSAGQPATPVDLDGAGDPEIVVLGDGGDIYAFNATGAEYSDGDANPGTIEPYITVPSASWAGAPAFADLDGLAGSELIAAATDGLLYAFKSDGSELFDGDGNAGTTGVLRAGAPLVTSPLLLNVAGDGIPEILVCENMGDSLRVSFVDATGAEASPAAGYDSHWPLVVPGQYAVAPGVVRTDAAPGTEFGIVVVSIDTLTSRAHVAYAPAAAGPVANKSAPVQLTAQPWSASFAIAGDIDRNRPSAPAVGDIDGDGFPELVITTPDGRLLVYAGRAAVGDDPGPSVTELRDRSLSAPALGDIDRDGALEIAVWDATWMYLLASNGRVMTDWPVRILPENLDPLPPLPVRPAGETPVIADLDGDGGIDVLFPLQDGAVYAFTRSATATPGFPRVGAARTQATPSVATLAAGSLSLVAFGATSSVTGSDNVADSLMTAGTATLSIQTLPGTDGGEDLPWVYYRGDVGRSGAPAFVAGQASATAGVDGASFIIYPNPVKEREVHARVMLNASATVRVQVFNLEGQEAFARTFQANPSGLAGTPFDEVIDVTDFVSGVYFMRLSIESAGGSESLVKPFAIRR